MNNVKIKKLSYNESRSESLIIKNISTSSINREQRDIISDINFDINKENDDSIKRVSTNLANIERMSKIKFTEINDNELNSTDDADEDDEDDNLILQRERGSTKRSTTLLEPTIYGRFSASGSVNYSISNMQTKLSNNIPVRDMSFNSSPSDSLTIDEANVFADIIEKLLDQLELIKLTIPVKVDDHWNENDKTMEDKYNCDSNDQLELLFNDDTKLLLSNKLSAMEKLQRDRTYIYNVLKNIEMNLKLNCRYDILENEIDNIAKISEAEHNLEINHEIWTEQLIQLDKLIVSEKIDNEIEIKKLLTLVNESGGKIENSILLCGTKLGYIKKWEESRLDQQKLLLELKEQMLQDKLSEYTKLEKSDDIISSELRIFYHSDIAKMEMDIELLSSQYNDEIEQYQHDIEYFNERINDVKEAIEKKYKIRYNRQLFIDQYENEQRDKINKAKYNNEINCAATIIQSIWRGFMVRHQLGDYGKLWKKLKKRKRLIAKRRKKT